MIEDIIRSIIREELERFFADQKTVPHEVQPLSADESEDSFFTHDEPKSEESMTTAQLLANLRELCGSDIERAKRAKDVVSEHFGYDRISLVPDDEARTVWNTLEADLA